MKANPWLGGQPGWYSLVSLFLSIIVLGVISINYSNRVAKESEAKFCSLMSTLNEAYTRVPPQTSTGKKMAADIARLHRDLNC